MRVSSSATFCVGKMPHSSIAVTFLMLEALRCSVTASAWPSLTVETVNFSRATTLVELSPSATSAPAAEPTATVALPSSKPE
jgi:hypothetical protein